MYFGIHQIFPCRKVVAPHSLLALSARYARCGIHQIFPCRKNLVEVRGVEPRSLSNPIKVATCLAPHFTLDFTTPVRQDL